MFAVLTSYVSSVCMCEIFSVKTIKSLKLPKWPHLHYYWVKSYFYSSKNLPAIFTNSKQSKTPFERNSVTYGTPCHTIGHFFFLLLPYYLQDTMPFPWSSSDFLLRVLQIWKSVFYSQAFFTLHSFLLISRSPGAGSLAVILARLHIEIFET